jgi:hypothetical protein
MASITVPFGTLSTVELHMGEVQTHTLRRDLLLTTYQRYKIHPTPMSIITSRWMTAASHAPRQTSESSNASTISGFELSKHSPTSTRILGQYTLTSDTASGTSHLGNQPLRALSQHCYAALETRIEQLLEGNELLAQELRDLHREKKEKKKQRKNKEKKVRLHKHIVLGVLRVVTAALRPMPEGSPARFVYMVVEGFFLWERDVEW